MSSFITFRHKGDFNRLERFFNALLDKKYLNILDKYGQKGIDALIAATPKDSGKTASSWSYEISHNKESSSISFYNDSVNEGVNIAIILQYGHGTPNGGYVTGTNYINPALKSVFDEIADKAWKEVSEL